MLGRVTDSGVTGSGVRWVRVEWFSGGTGFHYAGLSSGLIDKSNVHTVNSISKVEFDSRVRKCYDVRLVLPFDRLLSVDTTMDPPRGDRPELFVGDYVNLGTLMFVMIYKSTLVSLNVSSC